jgi:hypothetical protein
VNRRQFFLMLALAMTCAFAGGALSSRLFVAQPATAQETDVISARLIEAQEISLVDTRGIQRVHFFTNPYQTEPPYGSAVLIDLKDHTGIVPLRLGVDQYRDPFLSFFDRNGQFRGSIRGPVTGVTPKGLPPIPNVAELGGKADDFSMGSFRNLQAQVDRLRLELKTTIERVNLLSQ